MRPRVSNVRNMVAASRYRCYARQITQALDICIQGGIPSSSWLLNFPFTRPKIEYDTSRSDGKLAGNAC